MKAKYEDKISTYFDKWYRARTIHNCEERWKILKEKFNINENVDSWLTRMYRLHAHWVDAYLKDIFWVGMTTSQRSESINAFFDGYVNTKTRLVDFVCQYDKALANRRASESQEDFMTLNIVPTMCLRHPIEVQVSKLYTREIFKIFQDELTNGLSLFHEEMLKEEPKTIYLVGDFSEEREKWEEVTYDKSRELTVKCSCALFETDGILCSHILHIIWLLQLTAIPDNYILQRWKIDARHKNIRFFNVMDVRSNEGSMDQCDIIRLWTIRARFNATLEMASCLANVISMVERMLQDITLSVEKEVKLNEIHITNSQSGSQISSNANVVLRDGEEILIRDPSVPIKTKGRLRGASRYKSGIEESQSKKDIKHRKCGNC
ncbi:protein FAR1-RELATED SEQUENCE 5-like [Asparagus officinalis]|uniref:protein FAR1-RELATED SEQUENCE 5-like n=1 Tax=Asparagus officinalis TaxID=4686 RepID=UPI00098DEDB1|nr:protein FAR1-RELATED SEQUENCE 5-like [Asparagus officinalis]